MIIKKMTLGQTNNVYLVNNNNIKYIIRKYKYDKNIKNEIKLIKNLSSLNITPKIISLIKMGRIEEYFDGKNLIFNDLLNDVILNKIIDKIITIHNNSALFNNKILINLLINKTDNNLINELIISFNNLLIKYDNELVLCHNDLHINNIMINNNSEIKLIDFEFCGFNHWAYELINFICITKEQMISSNKYSEEYINNFIINFENKIIDIYSFKQNINKLLIRELMKEFKIYTYLYWYLWAIKVKNYKYQEYYYENILLLN